MTAPLSPDGATWWQAFSRSEAADSVIKRNPFLAWAAAPRPRCHVPQACGADPRKSTRGHYEMSWEILERLLAPEDKGLPCTVVPDANLRPCSECLHCHEEAQRIEEVLDEIATANTKVIA